MIDRPTPETKWYVTEYPIECSFAVTDGNEIIATIIGGDTIGNQCDLASRIAKLPDLERERDEAQNASEAFSALAWKLEGERNEAREQIKELIYIAERAIALAEIDFENDKFGVVSELRDGLEKIKEAAK